MREREAQDVLRHRAATVGIRRADAHRMVEAEPGMLPAEERTDEDRAVRGVVPRLDSTLVPWQQSIS